MNIICAQGPITVTNFMSGSKNTNRSVNGTLPGHPLEPQTKGFLRCINQARCFARAEYLLDRGQFAGVKV
eukprot:765993-Hanusia_phi.AAC.2